jgi:hypothetical protein
VVSGFVVLKINTTQHSLRRINMLATSCYAPSGRLVTYRRTAAGPFGPALCRMLDLDFREFFFYDVRE